MRIEEPFENDVAEQHVIIGTVESDPLSVLNARHSFSQDAKISLLCYEILQSKLLSTVPASGDSWILNP
jgi:hypothetical protein